MTLTQLKDIKMKITKSELKEMVKELVEESSIRDSMMEKSVAKELSKLQDVVMDLSEALEDDYSDYEVKKFILKWAENFYNEVW